MVEQSNGATDFDAAKIATTVTKHDEEFISVKNRLDALEAKFGNNERIAETLFEAAGKQTKFEEMFAKLFVKLSSTDENVKSAVAKIIGDVNESKFKVFLGKFGVWILSGITFVLGIIATVLITNALNSHMNAAQTQTPPANSPVSSTNNK